MTPDRLFERRWALALLQEVLRRLRQEFTDKGKEHLFEALRHYLIGEPSTIPYGRAALALGMSEGAVKVAVHRLRQRYRELLREEIAQTLETTSTEEIDEEIRQLFKALGS
jgi:RNA polymerase sigma-70 factor (ECF subfamily)